MTTKSFTLPLSRWHHVADRIAGIAKEKQAEALKALGNTQLTTAINEEQTKALKARGEKALQFVRDSQEAFSIVGTIRSALAEANARHSINTKLAEAESLRRRIQALEELASIDLVTRTPLANVNEVLATLPAGRDLSFGRAPAISVALVGADALDFISEELITFKANVAVITDQVAALNRATFSLDLPEALAKAAGVVSE